VTCNPACSLCFGASTSQCYGCRPDTTVLPVGYYYLEYGSTVCSTVCPYGEYAVNGSFSCEQCNMNCATCEGTDTYCLSCGYINSIDIVYLYQAKCTINCPAGTWYNSTVQLDHHCSPCHAYCSVCTGSLPSQCSSCANSSSPVVIYYLAINSTICDPNCPNGQYVDAAVANLCSACASQCVRCASSPTNCFQCAFNYFLDEVNNNCTAVCPSGQYNDLVITANYYYCRLCTAGCRTCTGPGLTVCHSCQNVTVNGSVSAIYYKEVTGSSCVTVCSLAQYFGNPLSNQCEQCQTGCVSCEFSSSYCYSCSSSYFKPLTSNSCVAVCPNGEYGNLTDNQCHECIYYTLQGSCVLTCPSGYFAQKINNSKAICQNCSDPSVTGNPCNRSYTFTVQTTYTNGGQDFQHKIYLSQLLSPNVTV
jgi:hypothetical protein